MEHARKGIPMTYDFSKNCMDAAAMHAVAMASPPTFRQTKWHEVDDTKPLPRQEFPRDDARRAAFAEDCPKCSAPAGERCRRTTGKPRVSCHRERHAAASAARRGGA